MSRKLWAAVTISLLAALAGCAPLPEPRAFLSPVRVYLPLASRPDTFGRGAALTHSSIDGCEDARKIRAQWAYNWTPEGIDCPGVLALPMLWSLDPANCPKIGPSNPILSLNEPSNAGAWGRAIAPEQVIDLTYFWRTSCFPGRQFSTPAEFAGQSGADATAWLTPWWDGYVAKYGTRPAEIMATHCYAGDANTCIASLQRDIAWAEQRGLRVLVTEWGIPPKWAGGEARARVEAAKLLRWMQTQQGIVGEAFFATVIFGYEGWWFGGSPTSLLDPLAHELTPWGRWYVEAR